MQQIRKVDQNELMQAMNTCDQLFEKLTDSYHDLESSFHHLSDSIESKQPSADELLSADRLAAILTALPGGVVILDGRGCIAQCNPAAEDMLGIPLVGEKWFDIITRAFAPKEDDGHDISLKDGRIVNISTTPLGNQPGQVVLLHDVTKTRALQENHMHNKRLAALGEMAASLAHQIRTPLSSALLYASHLKNPQLNVSRKEQMTDKVIAQIKHLEMLINDMLLFAKGGVVDQETFEVASLIADIEKSVETQLQGTTIEFTMINDVPEASILGNKEMLQSAVLNLVDNAIQAMSNEGRLQLRIAPAAGSIDIEVVDSGPGISSEKQQRIFEPFFTTRSNGTGLGLAVVKVIAQAHHGDAWVISKEGQGSTFGLRLPVLDQPQAMQRSISE